jgi:hypothetical protein
MGKIGFGYGSEWHLLWYLARHRAELNARVMDLTGADRVEWLDYPIRSGDDTRRDEEWKGLDFIADAAVTDAWREFWPQGAGIQNWDGIAGVSVHGREEWLLVEAKGHCAEIESSCGARPEGGLGKIRAALDITKQALSLSSSRSGACERSHVATVISVTFWVALGQEIAKRTTKASVKRLRQRYLNGGAVSTQVLLETRGRCTVIDAKDCRPARQQKPSNEWLAVKTCCPSCQSA